MKRLLLPLLGLSVFGCQPSTPPATPTQTAVMEFIKKNADDPASYAPARWGQETAYRQSNSNAGKKAELEKQVELYRRKATMAAEMEAGLAKAGVPKAELAAFKDKNSTDKMLLETYEAQLALLNSTSDTTLLGTSVVHAFRAKNKLGALVLDSATFLVAKDGKVSVLPK